MYNNPKESFIESIKGKKIAVVGLGRSNLPLIEFLLKFTNNITGFDKSNEDKLPEAVLKFKNMGVKFCLGENYLEGFKEYEIIFRTPGMRHDHPAFLEAVNNGAIITSEMELFLELCPAKTFGITGSDGKTTTTTLIYRMLVEEGYTCYLGGNIGNSLMGEIEKIKSTDMVVLELSSFQLMTMKKSTDVSVVTNITPNHLDVHKSMDEYIDAKKNIFIYQDKPFNKLILNYDNDIASSFVKIAKENVITKENVVFFSRKNNQIDGLIIKNDAIMFSCENKNQELLKINDIILPGVHNIENYMAAISAVMDVVKPETITKVANTFKGVEHRIEFVREINNIKIYNDSIASSPSRTIAGLNSFEQKVILMAGGCDKKLDYNELGYVMIDKVKDLVLVGQTAKSIQKAFESARNKTGKGIDIGVYMMEGFEDAIKKAFSIAKSGDIIIMSPASTSFDFFNNFEERGNFFKEVVMKL